MPTWASAGRTVQRGCEPSAINPLLGEKRERGRFLAAAILAQNGIFSIRGDPHPGTVPSSRQNRSASYVSVRCRRVRISQRSGGRQRIIKIPLPRRQSNVESEI